MKQNENILPLLPRGISGFWSSGEEPRPGVSSAGFKRLAYVIARNNQMIVSYTDSDKTSSGPNINSAESQCIS